MKYSFCIITDGNAMDRVEDMIDSISISARHRPFEVNVIGGGLSGEASCPNGNTIRYIPMEDEWIVKKKNLGAFISRGENIVYCHDYFLFDKGWFDAYDEFEELSDWDICSNPQYLMNGNRHFTDWVTWDDPDHGRYYPLNYYDWSRTKYQYISGGYFLVKRWVMIENLLNTKMQQGMPEDVEWSLRVRDRYKLKCNPDAIVRHNKIHRDCK